MTKKKTGRSDVVVELDWAEASKSLRSYLHDSVDWMKQQSPLLDERWLERVLPAVLARAPLLVYAERVSWLTALSDCARYGLDPDPILGHAYLTVNRFQAQPRQVIFMAGYKGLIHLACTHGGFDEVDARIVYDGEIASGAFTEIPEDPMRPFMHRPIYDAKGRGEPAGAYAIGWRGDGKRPRFKFVTTDEIDLSRARSQNPEDGPWATNWNEMAQKTAVRRMLALANLGTATPLAKILAERENEALSSAGSASGAAGAANAAVAHEPGEVRIELDADHQSH